MIGLLEFYKDLLLLVCQLSQLDQRTLNWRPWTLFLCNVPLALCLSPAVECQPSKPILNLNLFSTKRTEKCPQFYIIIILHNQFGHFEAFQFLKIFFCLVSAPPETLILFNWTDTFLIDQVSQSVSQSVQSKHLLSWQLIFWSKYFKREY